MEIGYRFNSLIKIYDIEFFIWRMEVITVQPKTHEYYFYA